MKEISASLDKPLQDIQSRILSQLEGKLKTATHIIDKLLTDKKEAARARSEPGGGAIASVIKDLGKMGPSRRLRYVFEKSSLYQIVDEIEKWQARYDPTWFIIMQKPITAIDDNLSGEEKKPSSKSIPIILAAKGIRDAVRAANDDEIYDPIWIDHLALEPSTIPHSTVQLSSSTGDTKEKVLVDVMVSHAEASAMQTEKAVRNLAHVLAQVDPATFGLLKCQGVMKHNGGGNLAVSPSTPSFKFIFSIPPKLTEPRSLRDVLLSTARYPLDEKIELAKKLVNSVLFVHTTHFVHKNIRPETIIAFRNGHSAIGAPFLVGFEQFRGEGDRTYRVGDGKWEHNLCTSTFLSFFLRPWTFALTISADRHPSRQGTHPEVDYEMRHDIYSLGVVLLEIGLWTSFVVFDRNEKPCLSRPHPILKSLVVSGARDTQQCAYENKQALELLAARELPSRLGKRYTRAVMQCLQCLDSEQDADADGPSLHRETVAHADQGDFTIGVRYIENIIEAMQTIIV